MRRWTESHAPMRRVDPAAMLSVAAHALILAAWIVATLPAANMPPDSISNRMYFVPPPDRPPRIAGSMETVRYVTLGPGVGVGPGPAQADAHHPISEPDVSAEPGKPVVDTTVSPEIRGTNDTQSDSVFTVLEVDTAVARSAASAAPAYPADLLKQHIEGLVRVRYVVDTTGYPDVASFEVLTATHPAFVAAVREALPGMRFTPAKMGARKVRQLVEQPFAFHITAAADQAASAPKKKPGRTRMRMP